MKIAMEVTLETICQRQQELKANQAELEAGIKIDIGKLEDKVDSGKIWTIMLAHPTISVAAAIMDSFLNTR